MFPERSTASTRTCCCENSPGATVNVTPPVWSEVFASCYANVQPLQLFGRGSGGGDYLSLFAYRGPRCTPRPRLVCHGPKMTLRQICRMLKLMKQVRNREAAAAAAARKQGSASPAPASPGTKSEKKCAPSCLRYKRSIKRVG